MKGQPRQFNIIDLSIWLLIVILSTAAPSVVLASETSSTNLAPQYTNKVVLTNFEARPDGNAVKLTWSTRSEQGTQSFQVIRGITSNFSEATLVANSSVSGQGEDGGEYEFLDETADTAVRYLYWLRETQDDGQIQIYGPTASLTSSASPAAINLADFSATVQAETGAIQVNWQTSSEMNTQGFWVLRSTTGQQADAVRINSEIIVSHGSLGGSYDYLDTSVLADLNYTYWIEEQEREQDGAPHIYGPITIAQSETPNLAIEINGTSGMPHRVMLPIIIR